MLFWKSSLCGALVLSMCGGCAMTSPSSAPRIDSTSIALAPSSQSAVLTSGREAADEEVLARLWLRRAHEGSPSDLPLGPGDVLEISVTPVAEVQNYATRVSGDGAISLPLIGSLQVAGVNESALSEAIRRRFAETYVRDPQVHVFVREYRSRLVAVVGAVEKPGAYNLTKGNDTLLDVISQAGGMTKEAAPRLLLFPAEAYANGVPVEIAASSSTPLGVTSAAAAAERPEPLVISLDSLARGSGQRYLTLPARPGDVIMAPASGEVLVDGWVDKPGSYKITPGLTMLGAVTAAGGLKFAADSSAVKITRTGRQNERVILFSDLEKVKSGESPDISLQEGDVIEVASSSAKLVPYGVYSFFANMFRLGATAPLY